MSQLPHQQGKKEIAGTTGNLIIFDLDTLIQFREEELSVQVLSDIGAARMVLFAFKAGQQLKEHSTSSQIFVHVLRGQITFSADNQSVEAQAGNVLQLEANVSHSITALSDAAVLVTMTPSPSFHSLEREVFQKHPPLVTRTDDGS